MVVKAEKQIHCAVVGDAMIGKSALIQAFMDDHSPAETYVATVLETFEGSVEVDGQNHHLSILDNAGQHDYENTRSCSYKDSEVMVICYSVDDRESMESVKDFWVPELNNCSRRRKPIVLVATQTDLRTDNGDTITTEEGKKLAKDIGADSFVECSAFDMDSVKTVIELMTTTGLKYRKRRSHFVNRFFGK